MQGFGRLFPRGRAEQAVLRRQEPSLGAKQQRLGPTPRLTAFNYYQPTNPDVYITFQRISLSQPTWIVVGWQQITLVKQLLYHS